MSEYLLRDFAELATINGKFGESCRLSLSDITVRAIKSGVLRLTINSGVPNREIENVDIFIGARSGSISLTFSYSGAKCYFGDNTSGAFDVRFFRNSHFKIGNSSTANGVKAVLDLSDISIGEDCLLSDDILIQAADQHGIVDLQTGMIVNNVPQKVHVGDHCWIGRKVTLLPGVVVGEGSIIGACAVVTKTIGPCSLAVGCPARIVKSDVSWSRAATQLDGWSKKLVEQFNLNGISS